MQRPVIEDVLDVLQEIQRTYAGHGARWTAFKLRQAAVQAVSTRELGKDRFANEPSATHSIQDACSRRLHLKIAEFDEAVGRLLSGDPASLKAILEPIPQDVNQRAAVALLFAAPSRPLTSPEPDGQRPFPQLAVDFTDAVEPERRETVINRIIRDTAMARSLKQRYQNRCQICDVAVALGPGRTYSEGHHIRPLGQPHNGPDTDDNILVLCPNHHAQCDYGAIKLILASLHRLPDHVIDENHIDYHNGLCTEA